MPHEADGILHCYYRKDTTTSNTCTTAAVDNDTDRKSEIVQTALDCLAQSEEPTRHSSSPALTLIIRLKVAPQVHDQLQALQAYRSNLLHQRKHKQPQENNSNSNDNNANQDHEVLYRVLLEWFLSYQTPLPLRRAIQSNLEVLLQEEHESSSNDNNNNSFQQTQITVLSSLWTNQAAWQQPLHSLQEALNYGTTHDILLQNTSYVQQMLQFLADYAKEQLQPILEPVLNDYSNNKGNNDQEAFFVEAQVSNAIQLGVQWAGIVKTILSDAFSMVIADQENNKNNSDHRLLPILQSLQDFIWQLLLCRITPTDALSNLGMAYSRVLFLIHPPLSTRNGVSYQLQQIISSQSTLTSLTAIAIVQGMAAVVPIRIMLTESHAFQTYFQTQCRQADPGVRLAALKGIHTLVSRCLTRVTTTSDGGNSSTASSSSSIDREELQAIQGMIQGTLEIVLQAWENPPNRRLGNAIPSLFQKLVSLMQQVGPATNSSSDDATTTFQDLVKRLLAQPSNRKGRYKALETLLPIVGSRQMIALGGWKLMESLLEGIGDRNSHNAGTIADLWAKILSDLLQDMLQETYGTNEKEIESGPFSQKKASKKKRDYEPEQIQSILPKWLEAWVPSLASMLLSPTPTRRKQVAAFCLPRIMDMVGGRKRQVAAVSAFACLLKEVHKCTYGKGARDDGEDDDHIHRLGQMSDHALWASLEVSLFLLSLICCFAVTTGVTQWPFHFIRMSISF